MRRSGRKGAGGRFSGVYLLGTEAKENISDFVLKKETRRAQSRGKKNDLSRFYSRDGRARGVQSTRKLDAGAGKKDKKCGKGERVLRGM